MKRKLATFFLSFAIGCTFGILGAWTDHCDEIATYQESYPNKISHAEVYPFWEWVTCPLALPGLITAIYEHSQDWLIDEEWNYRWTIMFANGAAYASFYCAFLVFKSLVKTVGRKTVLKADHAR